MKGPHFIPTDREGTVTEQPHCPFVFSLMTDGIDVFHAKWKQQKSIVFINN